MRDGTGKSSKSPSQRHSSAHAPCPASRSVERYVWLVQVSDDATDGYYYEGYDQEDGGAEEAVYRLNAEVTKLHNVRGEGGPVGSS